MINKTKTRHKDNRVVSPSSRNTIVVEMNKLNRSKVYRNRKHNLRANDTYRLIKDFYNGRL